MPGLLGCPTVIYQLNRGNVKQVSKNVQKNNEAFWESMNGHGKPHMAWTNNICGSMLRPQMCDYDISVAKGQGFPDEPKNQLLLLWENSEYLITAHLRMKPQN